MVSTNDKFPDIGHLTVLTGTSTTALLLLYLIFGNLEYNLIPSQFKECIPTLKDIETGIDNEPFSLDLSKKLTDKITKQVGGFDINMYSQYYDILYKLSSIYYSAVIIILLSTYVYTVFCNESISHHVIYGCILSLIFIILTFYLIGRYKVYQYSYIIIISIFIIFSIFLLILSLFPIENRPHWTTYLYPFGVVLTIGINYYISHNYQLPVIIQISILFALSAIFIFLPYVLSYIYNVQEMC